MIEELEPRKMKLVKKYLERRRKMKLFLLSLLAFQIPLTCTLILLVPTWLIPLVTVSMICWIVDTHLMMWVSPSTRELQILGEEA
jgi:hypothetical protein